MGNDESALRQKKKSDPPSNCQFMLSVHNHPRLFFPTSINCGSSLPSSLKPSNKQQNHLYIYIFRERNSSLLFPLDSRLPWGWTPIELRAWNVVKRCWEFRRRKCRRLRNRRRRFTKSACRLRRLHFRNSSISSLRCSSRMIRFTDSRTKRGSQNCF